ncbi:MAG: OPT/YSL family transporter [Candidatus Omnitrophica bacterium]|nr:OPT/YSL family transporter [Candidatus Omnitrophota bacterium]
MNNEKGTINQLEPFEDGFNIKSIIAALFIGFIMLPGTIYMSLVSGAGIGGAASWVTVILFIEIAKRSFITLKKQEIYIIFIIAAGTMSAGAVMGASGLVISGGMFGSPVWDQYFRQSTYAGAFGLRDIIPNWIVPPAGSEALFKRTFFHRDWLLPLTILLIHQVLFLVNRISLGYTLFRFTSDVEKLPFPLARVQSEGCLALAETSGKKEGWRWRIFSIGTMIGVIFGAFRVGIPTFTGLFMTKPLMLIPIPWVDYTSKLGTFLPASMFGFMTDLSIVFAGFIIPFWVVFGTFIGCIVSKLIINPICYYKGLIHNWRPSMTVIPTQVTTTLDLWLSITIGIGIIVGLIGVWKVISAFTKKRKEKSERVELPEGRGDMPIWLGAVIWFLSTTAYVILCHKLVPDFPVWLFCFFGYFMTPFLSYISARMFGITGSVTGITFPMVKEGSFLLSGYKGAAIWFAPVPYYNHGATAQEFKQLELTRTKFTSYYKALGASFIIMAFCSFLFWSLIWRMGPIPSAAYPYVHKMWPLWSITKALWASSTLGEGIPWILQAINPGRIFIGAIGGGAMYLLLSLLHLPIGIFYGMVGGISMMPHNAIPMFIGALFGRYFFSKRFGEKTWRSYTPILLAGYGCGVGLVGMAAVGLALIVKSVSQLIF